MAKSSFFNVIACQTNAAVASFKTFHEFQTLIEHHKKLQLPYLLILAFQLYNHVHQVMQQVDEHLTYRDHFDSGIREGIAKRRNFFNKDLYEKIVLKLTRKQTVRRVNAWLFGVAAP